MTDRDIEIAMDRVTGRVWDETKCRVCGRAVGGSKYDCSNKAARGCVRNSGYYGRADDPLPHTTSYEQMAKDREMLTDNQWKVFICELGNITRGSYLSIRWKRDRALLNATLRQQCIAYLRACGVEVEG